MSISSSRQSSLWFSRWFTCPERKAFALPFLLAVLVSCSEPPPSTDTTQSSKAETETEEPAKKGETLLLEPPPAWVRVSQEVDDKFRLAEFIPVSQETDEWQDKIFIESNSLLPLPDPILFLEAMGREIKTECDGTSDANVYSGVENGYETSVRLLICNKNRNSARGEVTLIKAIRGNDNFYVISRARRSEVLQTDSSPLPDKEMGEWSLYMRSVKLCDTRDANHPCPKSL